MREVNRKYIVHVSGVGLATVLVFYASTCAPLPFSEITRVARNFVDPACVVQSYEVSVPELPQNHSPVPTNNSAVFGTPASNVSTSISPSFEIPESK